MDVSHSLYIPFIEFYLDDLSACSSCLFGLSLPHPRCRDTICRWTNTLCLLITMAASLLLFDSRSSSHDCVFVAMRFWCCVSVCNACSVVRESQRCVPCGAGARPAPKLHVAKQANSFSERYPNSRSHKIASSDERLSPDNFSTFTCVCSKFN